MPAVLIRCPETGVVVPTGLEVTLDAAARMRWGEGVLAECPSCGREHRWGADDVLVD